MPGKLRKIVIVGAGGHAKVILEAIRAAGNAEVVGMIDPSPNSTQTLGVPILGGDDVLPELYRAGITSAVVAIGSNARRERIGDWLVSLGFELPAIVHPSAFISPSAKVDDGAVIMARAVIGTQTIIGRLAVINTMATIDHDNEIGTAAHIAPSCGLAGNVRVGRRTLVGVGCAVRPGVKIGDDVVVGAGAAVVNDIQDGSVVGGVPARSLKRSALLSVAPDKV
jgi:UDP-perosamine 4-acetyltransferase